jgi:hypothetical protein
MKSEVDEKAAFSEMGKRGAGKKKAMTPEALDARRANLDKARKARTDKVAKLEAEAKELRGIIRELLPCASSTALSSKGRRALERVKDRARAIVYSGNIET